MAATSHHSSNRFASLARKQDFADFNLAGPPRGHYASLMLKRAHNLIYSEVKMSISSDEWGTQINDAIIIILIVTNYIIVIGKTNFCPTSFGLGL